MNFHSSFRWEAGTDPGNRPQNEDRLILMPEYGFFAVCDGMGGFSGGEAAAELVKLHFEERIAALSEPSSHAAAGRLLRREIRCFSAAMQKVSCEAGLQFGATMCALWLVGERAVFANIGDSRAYGLHSTLTQITRDHSIAGILVEQGEITKDEARTHPAASRLLRYIGMDGAAKADVFFGRVRPGDILLLCSDGLSAMVGDDELAGILAGMQDLEAGITALIGAANRNGGKDNISAVLVRIDNKSYNSEDAADGNH